MIEKPRVLIVEDEFLVALDLEDILAKAGYRVVGIAADSKAVASLAAAPDVAPELALVDINLRDGPTGVEIAHTLARAYGTTIIFVTANPAQITAPPETAVGYVQKPFSAETIESSISRALASGRSGRTDGLPRLH